MENPKNTKVIKSIPELRSYLLQERLKGKSVGLVPTMGALHDGHAALIRKAKKKTDVVVLSIFLNPIQFSDPVDLKCYPKTLKRDLKLAESYRVDVVFMPAPREIYPKGFSTYVIQESLTQNLCGRGRPGHFRGVTTIVAKLFNIVQPDMAFFGHKDAQQLRVVRRMVEELNWDIQIEGVGIVREPTGLAMSSRNKLLSKEDLEGALSLNEALFMSKVMILAGERASVKIIKKMKKIISSYKGAKIEYIEIVDDENLKPLKKIKGKILIAVAVWFKKVRLIDNLLLEV